MPTLDELVLDVDVLLQLQPGELAGPVLMALPGNRAEPNVFISSLFHLNEERYPRQQEAAVKSAILEAWAWLEREGLIAEKHDPSGPREYFITRRGQSITSDNDFEAFRKASILKRSGRLHFYRRMLSIL